MKKTMNKEEFMTWAKNIVRQSNEEILNDRISRHDNSCRYMATVFTDDKGRYVHRIIDIKTGGQGMAICRKDEKYDFLIGRSLAWCRLKNIPIPEVAEIKKVSELNIGDTFETIGEGNKYKIVNPLFEEMSIVMNYSDKKIYTFNPYIEVII